MPPTAQRVLDIAAGEVGYREGRNNANKYSAAYGVPHSSWCGYFTRWCMEQAGMHITQNGVGGTEPSAVFTPNGAECYQKLGRWTPRHGLPRAGYLVFFDFGMSQNVGSNVDHVGFVHSLNADGSVNTIEGNGLPDDTGVLTPTGWVPIGDLRVGDPVCEPSGEQSFVTGVFPQGERPVYELTLSDGQKIVADDNHRWKVRRHRRQSWTVMTTAEMVAAGGRYHLPPVEVQDFGPPSFLPVDPWLLGVLLGDAHLGAGKNEIAISCGEKAFADRILEAVGPNHEIRIVRRDYERPEHAEGVEHHIRGPLVQQLRDLGVWGELAHQKHVPNAYLWASAKDRLAILQGLLDTDGDVDQGGRAAFNTTSPQLAEDVAHLVRSLGGITRVGVHHPIYRRTSDSPDVRRRGRDSYRCGNIRFSDPDICPVTRTHKVERWRVGWTRPLAVTSIEPAGRTATTCISVSATSRLFLAEGFIPTHNTLDTDNGNQAAGGGVWRKIRQRAVIVGFGIPLYSNPVAPEKPFDWAALARLAQVIQQSQHSISEVDA